MRKPVQIAGRSQQWWRGTRMRIWMRFLDFMLWPEASRSYFNELLKDGGIKGDRRNRRTFWSPKYESTNWFMSLWRPFNLCTSDQKKPKNLLVSRDESTNWLMSLRRPFNWCTSNQMFYDTKSNHNYDRSGLDKPLLKTRWCDYTRVTHNVTLHMVCLKGYTDGV